MDEGVSLVLGSEWAMIGLCQRLTLRDVDVVLVRRLLDPDCVHHQPSPIAIWFRRRVVESESAITSSSLFSIAL